MNGAVKRLRDNPERFAEIARPFLHAALAVADGDGDGTATVEETGASSRRSARTRPPPPRPRRPSTPTPTAGSARARSWRPSPATSPCPSRPDARGAPPLRVPHPQAVRAHRAHRLRRTARPASPRGARPLSPRTAGGRPGGPARRCGAAGQHARTREQFARPIGAFWTVRRSAAERLVRAGPVRAAGPAAAGPAGTASLRQLAAETAAPAVRRRRPGARRQGPHLGVRRPPAPCDPPERAPLAPVAARRVRRCSRRGPAPDRPDGGAALRRRRGRGRGVSRIVAHGRHGASAPVRARGRTRHGPESVPRSGTLCGMRVVPRLSRPGGAPEAAPYPAMRAAREAGRIPVPACSTPRGERRTVCRTRTPSRWNMPEALVGVTVRQPCCLARESRSVILVLAMQKMATIVALVRREAMCPPVRMV